MTAIPKDTDLVLKRLEGLQKLTAALSSAALPEDIYRAILEQSNKILNMRAGGVTVLHDNDMLEIIAHQGQPAAVIAAQRYMKRDADHPLAEVIRTGEALYFHSAEERNARYPHLVQFFSPETRSSAFVPLRTAEKTIGVLTLSFPEPHAFDADERLFIASLASVCSQALERSRNYASEKAAAEHYHTLFHSVDQGFCIFEMLYDEQGVARDYRFLEVNPKFEEHTGLKDAAGKTAKELVPGLEQHWIDIYDTIARTGRSYEFEQGSAAMGRYFEVSGVRVGDPASRKVALLFKDVTERKRAEEQLRIANERFQIAEDAANGFLYDYDLTTGKETRSAGFKKVLGYSDDDVPVGGTFWEAFVHPDDVAEVQAETARALHPGVTEARYEYRIRHKKGHWVWVLDKTAMIRNHEDKVVRMIGSIIDISERKDMEDRLKRSERDLRLITDSMPALVSYIDPEYRYRQANKTYLDWFDLKFGDIIGKTIPEVLGQAAFEKILPFLKSALAGQPQTFEVEIPYKEGRARYVNAIYTPNYQDGVVAGVFVHIVDITERKRLEAEITRQYDELDMIYRTAPIGLGLIDRDFRFLRINEQLAEMNGVSAEAHLGRTVREILPLLADEAETYLLRVFERGEAIVNLELEGETPAQPGVQRVWKENWYPLKNARNETIAVSMVVEEITQRRAAQSVLERYRLLSEKAHDIVWMARADGQIVEVNEAAIKTYGYSREELLTMNVRDLREASTRPSLETHLRQALGQGAQFETMHLRKDGSSFPVEVNASSADFAGERLIMSIVRDITERKRAEEQLRIANERFRIAEDAANGFLYDYDVRTGAETRSEGFTKVLGYGPDEVPGFGASWETLMHPDDLARVKQETERALKMGTGTQYEYRIRHQDGRWLWVLDKNIIVRDAQGRSERIIGSIIDITERKLAEEALKEADKRKDEFLAVLGHELRNPLAPIRMGVELMKRSDDPTVLKEARDIIARQSEQLTHLLDDLLDVSRISRGTITLEKENVALQDIIDLACESTRSLFDDRSQRLIVSLPPVQIFVNADKTRLCQIIVNLLTNAAKYTDIGGRVTLGVRQEAGEVVIVVEDNGIGIPQNMLDKVFDMFTRVERQNQYHHQGLGIGLSLVKRLIEMHDGTVEVYSAGEGKGSTFTLRLSASHAEVQPMALSGADMVASRRVLVVDDNVANLNMLSAVLKLMGHEVKGVNSGERALEHIRTFNPEFILLDLNMPGLSGYTTAKRIREMLASTVQLVAMTGYGQEQDIKQTLAAGFDYHLVKPVDMALLASLLNMQEAVRAEPV